MGAAVRELRTGLGWTQAVLARKAGVSQSLVSAIERGELADLTLRTAGRVLNPMGAHLDLQVRLPFLAGGGRQRDPAHVDVAGHVRRRLATLGWDVHAEVEVGGDRSRGWIDVLAHHRASGVVLVIEVKTELNDLGAVERVLGWYEREAWAAARRLGWRPRTVIGGVLLLLTKASDDRVRRNAESLRLSFPLRARGLSAVLEGNGPARRGRFLAMVDPRSRRRAWLRPTVLDGRRTDAPYTDYVGYLAAGHRIGR